ncbi:MAG TPA: methyltransferase, partial [Myxococcales bacterium]
MPSRQATRRASARAAKPSSDEPEVTLSRRGLERLRSGHVWVYRSDLRAPSVLQGGEVVRLVDDRGWF